MNKTEKASKTKRKPQEVVQRATILLGQSHPAVMRDACSRVSTRTLTGSLDTETAPHCEAR